MQQTRNQRQGSCTLRGLYFTVATAQAPSDAVTPLAVFCGLSITRLADRPWVARLALRVAQRLAQAALVRRRQRRVRPAVLDDGHEAHHQGGLAELAREERLVVGRDEDAGGGVGEDAAGVGEEAVRHVAEACGPPPEEERQRRRKGRGGRAESRLIVRRDESAAEEEEEKRCGAPQVHDMHRKQPPCEEAQSSSAAPSGRRSVFLWVMSLERQTCCTSSPRSEMKRTCEAGTNMQRRAGGSDDGSENDILTEWCRRNKARNSGAASCRCLGRCRGCEESPHTDLVAVNEMNLEPLPQGQPVRREGLVEGAAAAAENVLREEQIVTEEEGATHPNHKVRISKTTIYLLLRLS